MNARRLFLCLLLLSLALLALAACAGNGNLPGTTEPPQSVGGTSVPVTTTPPATTAVTTTLPVTTTPPVTTAAPIVIDGVMEDAYLSGQTLLSKPVYLYSTDPALQESRGEDRLRDAEATVQLLFDGAGTLYVFATVTDLDDYARDAAYCAEDDPWENDNFEFYYIMGGDTLDRNLYTLIMADANGHAVHYYRHAGTPTDPPAGFACRAVKDSQGRGLPMTYYVELAIPVKTEAGRALAEDERVYFSIELGNRTLNADEVEVSLNTGGRAHDDLFTAYTLSDLAAD